MNKALTFLVLLSSYGILFLDEARILELGKEDGVVENIGAIFFLTASVLLFAAYFKSTHHGNRFWSFSTRRNIFYLLLGLLLFVCFGEEISWGQRIIGWDTPEAIKSMNLQEETNLHNLDIFYGKGADPKDRSGWSRVFNLLTLFSLFWLAYFVFVPLLNKFSRMARRLCEHVGLPVPALWIGGLFLANYAIFKLLNMEGMGFEEKVLESLNELKETNYAFSYAVFGLHEFTLMLTHTKTNSSQRLPEGSGRASQA